MNTAGTDQLKIDSLARTVPLSLRWIIGVSGAGLVTSGAVAVFIISNGSGTAALITAGIVLIVVALLAERLESVEAAGMKLGTRAQAAAHEKEGGGRRR